MSSRERRYVFAGDWPSLEGAFVAEVARLRAEDRLRPLTVVAGSNRLGAALERRAARARGGLANVRFLTFRDLVGRNAPVGDAPHPMAGRVVAEEILSRQLDGGPVFPASFAETLVRTFDDLAEGGCDAAEARRLTGRPEPGNRAREALRLYADWREQLAAIGADDHGRFEVAAAGIAEAGIDGPVVFYGFYDLNELQWRLLQAVAASAGAILFVPFEEKDAYRFAGLFRDRLDAAGFAGERVAGEGGEAPFLESLTAPDEEEEVRAVVRRILRFAGEEDVSFGRIAVMPVSWDAYAPLFREAFAEAGVPCVSTGRLIDGGHGSATGALRLLAALGGGLARNTVVDLVSSPALGAGGEEARGVLDEWIRLTGEAGIRGETGWAGETRRLAGRLGGEAAAALGAAAAVLETLERGAARLGSEDTWAGMAEALVGLFDELIAADDRTPVVREAFTGLGALDATGARADTGRFLGLARETLLGIADDAGPPRGAGVHLLGPGGARGLTFEAVFLPGLVEGSVPRRARQDPFLPDDDRALIARLSGGGVVLSPRGERVDEEALIFRLAAKAARRLLVCSRPRFEGGTGKETLPAALLEDLEAAALAEESAFRVAELPSPWRSPDGVEPLGGGEWAFFETIRAGALAEDDRFARRGARAIEARWGDRRFTPFDGVFEGGDALAALSASLDGRGWRFSPTALETYARCPFAYFVSRLLGLEPREEPEETVTISPLQRGTVVHRILAGAYGRFAAEGLLPLAGPTVGRARTIAGAVAAEELDRLEEIEPTGIPVFWRFERERIAAAIDAHVEAEAAAEETAVPVMFERSFGLDRNEAPGIDAGKRRIGLRGRIDRIDLEGDRGFRVVDYKTGSLASLRNESIAGGAALQLPLYLVAGAALLGRDVRNGRAEYRRIGGGGGCVRFSGSTWETEGESIGQTIAVLVEGIAAGRFPALPDGQGCARSFCPARGVCVSGRSVLARIKGTDPSVRDLLRLHGRDTDGGRGGPA
ncbi:MAG: PD-(D/E)XK nuclease family protein [Candidatus Krumholzibacteriota bacterium]|nr:PD-(D/E)XK nuclease family protein [Candidatus Krumholzibacteriota bacterium]